MQINKEKRQAFAEFLTPEDATTALSFDGRSLNGSALRIRRPKEYVEMVVRFPSFPHQCWFVFFFMWMTFKFRLLGLAETTPHNFPSLF
jgi:hypothetical protein